MALFGGASDGGAAQAEAQRQAAITQGTNEINQNFSQFTPQFYAQAGQDYTNFAEPQLISQYQNTRNNLTGALGRAGILNSSAAAQENTSLGKQMGLAQSEVANNAQQQVNSLQGQVATQKGNLINELESSGDPTAANEEAIGAVSQLREPTALQPLGNMFSDWAEQYLGSQTQAVNGNNLNPISALSQLFGNQNPGGPQPAGGSSYYVN